ncbi:rhodanese-like domain-containing protein [Adhaeribacter soli]|uniref:Rhodanese-like domain-containing protein n=1 Tax=Adhaeribacter soli TaxID=2607655 RepID=A0A5N1ISC8_9BACT|nr:rhodanese-like domain-containing protein [Adhaeribacter soli]KAA9332821.1 rhodanese-like domain-containing protein [Adhaeribacter soli]
MKNLLLYFLVAFTFAFSSCVQNPSATNHNLTAPAVKNLVQTNPEVIILDVRTPEEYAAGHVAGAVNLDYYAPDFAEQLDKLDRQKTYLLYCASGNRSGKAAAIFKEKHFPKFYNSTAGFTGLKAEGVPTN